MLRNYRYTFHGLDAIRLTVQVEYILQGACLCLPQPQS